MMLLGEWHEWFSYGWWTDIGVPALGALGSIAVGTGAIAVAFHSNRISKSADAREAATLNRTERREFGMLATKWLTAAMDELTHPETAVLTESVGATAGGIAASMRRATERSSGDYKQELDVQAAAVGQHAGNLLGSIQQRVDQMGELGNNRGRALAVLGHRYLRQSIQHWVAEPGAVVSDGAGILARNR